MFRAVPENVLRGAAANYFVYATPPDNDFLRWSPRPDIYNLEIPPPLDM